MYVGKTGRSVKIAKRNALMRLTLLTLKSPFYMEFQYKIDWDNVKILISESHAYGRHVAESVLINQKAPSLNVIDRNDDANVPAANK